MFLSFLHVLTSCLARFHWKNINGGVFLKRHRKKCSCLSHTHGKKSFIFHGEGEVVRAVFVLMESICNWWRSMTSMGAVKGLRRVLGVLCVRRYRWRHGMCFVNSQGSLLAFWKWVWSCLIFGYHLVQTQTAQVVGPSVCFPVACCSFWMVVKFLPCFSWGGKGGLPCVWPCAWTCHWKKCFCLSHTHGKKSVQGVWETGLEVGKKWLECSLWLAIALISSLVPRLLPLARVLKGDDNPLRSLSASNSHGSAKVTERYSFY